MRQEKGQKTGGRRGAREAKDKDRRAKAGKYQEWLTEDGLLKLEAWARNGLSMEEVAHNCGCSLSTLKDWRKRYPPISAALKRGREVTDIVVENALYRSAQGYTVELRRPIKLKRVEYDDKGKKLREYEEIGEAMEEEHIPANVTAQIYWLKNRKPEEWRDRKPEDALTGTGEISVEFVGEETLNG